MTAQTKDTLKTYFNTGDKPTEGQFVHLIDTIGQVSLTVAANDAPNSSKGRADYVCDGINDEVQIQAAIDALPAAGGRVVLSSGTFVCSKVGVATTPAQGYSILIDQNDGAIDLVGSGWSTILKLADTQDANTCLILIRGDSGDLRTSKTSIKNMKINGNKTGQVAPSTDFSTVEVAYAYDLLFDNLWIVDPTHVCIRPVFRTAERAIVSNCLIDASNGKIGIRTEGKYCTISNNHILASDVSGSGAGLDISTNADVSTPSEFVIATGNIVDGGINQCVLSGARHCTVSNNQFVDSLDNNGVSLLLSGYNSVTDYDAFENIISVNLFTNVRNGIQLAGTTADLQCLRNIIHGNMIAEGSGVNLNFGIRETGDTLYSDYNMISNNMIVGASTPLTILGANTVSSNNVTI